MSFLARSPPGDKSSHGCSTYYTPISARSSPCPVPWYLARTGRVAAAQPRGDGNESGWGWREKRAILRSLKEAGSCPKSLSRPGFCPICTTGPKRFRGILPTDLRRGGVSAEGGAVETLPSPASPSGPAWPPASCGRAC